MYICTRYTTMEFTRPKHPFMRWVSTADNFDHGKYQIRTCPIKNARQRTVHVNSLIQVVGPAAHSRLEQSRRHDDGPAAHSRLEQSRRHDDGPAAHSRLEQQARVRLQLLTMQVMQPSQICVFFITSWLNLIIILNVVLCE